MLYASQCWMSEKTDTLWSLPLYTFSIFFPTLLLKRKYVVVFKTAMEGVKQSRKTLQIKTDIKKNLPGIRGQGSNPSPLRQVRPCEIFDITTDVISVVVGTLI